MVSQNMANNIKIDTAVKPLISYICSPDHLQSAIKCEYFLNGFNTLKPWRAEYPDDKRHSVWYISFNTDKEEPYILNLNIRPAHFQVEFRQPQFLPQEIAKKLKVNQKWLCANSNKFTFSELQEMMRSYIVKIKDPFDKGQIKFGKWHPLHLEKNVIRN